MNINAAPIYDFGAWIDIAPDFDWDLLVPPVEPEPDPVPEV